MPVAANQCVRLQRALSEASTTETSGDAAIQLSNTVQQLKSTNTATNAQPLSLFRSQSPENLPSSY